MIHNADSLAWMREQKDGCVTAIVTDPPYGLKFMGKKWDYDVPSVEFWTEALRVLKPGGTLLSFAGSRTCHRMTVNIEDAGFVIKDTILWLYGQGFPKGQDIGKALDKLAGAEREVTGVSSVTGTRHNLGDEKFGNGNGIPANVNLITAPATDEAKEFDGYKSHCLKPAYEPIIMAMKPNEGSYAKNALAHGVAGLNIDACRVPGAIQVVPNAELWVTREGVGAFGTGTGRDGTMSRSEGRYPANIMHDGSPEVLAGFPESNARGGGLATGTKGGKGGLFGQGSNTYDGRGSTYFDKGTAARFFYCAKARRGEGNTHPTVKPLELMKWLVRLVAPPKGGVILDPFMGSGTTGVACQGVCDFIGIERDPEYFEIARKRIAGA